MKELLSDLKALPGVLGACLYHGQKGTLESNLPPFFKADKITEISRMLMKIHVAGRMSFHDLTDFCLQYDEAVILARELDENLLIFTLCTPDFNQNLVTMSLNLVKKDLQNNNHLLPDPVTVIETISEAQSETLTDSAAESSTPPSEQILPVLTAMKGHLPRVMGPIADMIFEESLESWQKQSNGSLADLDALISMLEEQIGNPDKILSYKKMIAPILGRVAGKG
jgi:hypothetical protein